MQNDNEATVPPYLQDVKISRAQEAEFAKNLEQSWANIHEYVTSADAEKLARMIKYEFLNKRRRYEILRMTGRLNALTSSNRTEETRRCLG